MRTLLTILLLASATIISTPARADHRRPDIWIKYQDLPRRVREVVDRERGRREIKQILELRRDNHLYYRVLIDERGADLALFVSESGRILKASEVPDVAVGEGSFEKWVKYNDLPREVRRTLDQERGNRDVKQIYFVRRDNREFYRCIIDTRGDDLAVRIGSNGKILSFEEVDDIAVSPREISRYDYSRERWIRYDDVPRDVRRSIDLQREGRPVKQIVFVERNGRRFYRCIIDDRRGDRILRLSEDGYIYEENEVPDIAVGSGGFDSNRWGHENWMKYDDLPWNVRETLDRERRGRPVKQILYVRRGNYTFYRCIIDTRGDDTAVRISDSGRLLSREEVDDVSFGKDENDYAVAREEWIKYRSMPGSAQAVLDHYRKGRDVLKIIKIDYKGRTTYRCTIDTHPWPTTIRITEEGRMMGED